MKKNGITNEQILKEIKYGFNLVDKRFDGVETRLDGVETRLDGVETRLDGVECRLFAVEKGIDELAMITKVQFDEIDRKLSILSRTRGPRFWP